MLDSIFTNDNLPTPGFTLFFLLFCLLIRFLHVLSCNEEPIVVTRKSNQSSNVKEESNINLREILGKCQILKKKYVPPTFWGRNGHLQTAVYGILGHASLRRVYNRRHYVKLESDPKTTVTFDVFEPTKEHFSGNDYTILMCPGIANSSESNYIRTCVHNAQENGYRCVVLNHLGALVDVKLTSDHIFSYGGTAEMHTMLKVISNTYPSTRFMVVGFSMGANIVTRCLSEVKDPIANRILLGISVCQGYSATDSAAYYHDWECGRRVYNYVITENMKRLLRRNYERAVLPHSKAGIIDEKRIWSSTSIMALDDNYSRRVHGFATVQEYYDYSSCLTRIPHIRTPIIFANAADDPLIPEPLWRPVMAMCAGENGEDVSHAFVLLKHGGHLGFLEGGALKPNSRSWLDRFIVEVADAATATI